MHTLVNARGLPRGQLPLDQRGLASDMSTSVGLFNDEVAAAAPMRMVPTSRA